MVFKCHQKSIRIWQFVTKAGKNKETPATLHIATTQLMPLLWLLCRTAQFLAEEWFAMQTSARHSSNFWLPFKCFYWVISWCHLLQFAKTEIRERKQKDKSDYGYWAENSSLAFPGFPFLCNFSASWCKILPWQGSIYNWHFLILLSSVLINSTISCRLLYPSTPISPARNWKYLLLFFLLMQSSKCKFSASKALCNILHNRHVTLIAISKLCKSHLTLAPS